MARPLSDSINAPLRIPFRRFATQVIFSVVVTLVSNLLQIYGLLYAAIPFAILGVSVTHLALDRYTSSARSGSFPYCFILGCSLAYLHQLTTVIGQNFADGAPGFGRTQCGRALWLCVSRHLGARVLAQIPGHGQKCLVARAKSDEICRSTFVHGWPSTVHARPRYLRLRRCRETIKRGDIRYFDFWPGLPLPLSRRADERSYHECSQLRRERLKRFLVGDGERKGAFWRGRED